jgi:1-acyl-sn-glycerol-3-phosphate acyltransferase
MQAEPHVPVDRSVLDMCAELAPEPGLALDPNTVLADVGFDSLGCADLAVAIEERFGVRLPDAEVAEFKTVKEVASAVKAGVKARRERIPKDLGRSQLAAKRVVRPILAAYSRLRVEGADNVPATGPVLIAPNHRSMFDIPIAVIAAPRRVFFMAKQELFGDPIRDRLWLELGGFPVKRQIADVRSVDTASALLEGGGALVIYPEGKRSKTAEMLPFLGGAAWLALRLGVPIVPCGVIGTGHHPGWDGKAAPWIGKHIRVAYGEPIRVEREPDPRTRRLKAEELTGHLLAAVNALLGP